MLHGDRPGRGPRRAARRARPVRGRQVHAAAGGRRAGAGHRPGRVLIAGRDVTRLRPGRRNVSMVFQSYALFPHLTRRGEHRLRPRSCGTRRRREARGAGPSRRPRSVGCGHLLDRRPGQLSGGERQRVALARALVRRAGRLPARRAAVQSGPGAAGGDPRRAQGAARPGRRHDGPRHPRPDRGAGAGRPDRRDARRAVEQVGTPEEIWRRPATTFVARFVGSPAMNLLPARRPAAAGGAPGVPGCGRLDRLPARGGAARPRVGPVTAAGVVERVDVVGEDAYVYVRAGGAPGRRPGAGRRAAPARRAVTGPVRWPDAHVFDAAAGDGWSRREPGRRPVVDPSERRHLGLMLAPYLIGLARAGAAARSP